MGNLDAVVEHRRTGSVNQHIKISLYADVIVPDEAWLGRYASRARERASFGLSESYLFPPNASGFSQKAGLDFGTKQHRGHAGTSVDGHYLLSNFCNGLAGAFESCKRTILPDHRTTMRV